MQCGQRVGNSILLQVVADRHLAAERIAPEGDAHLARRVGRRLDQHRNAQIGEADRIGQAALFAEVRQRDNQPVYLGSVRLEQRRALLRVLVSLHRAVCGDIRMEHDGLDTGGFECGDDFEAAAGCKVRREESAVAYQNSHGHWS